MNLSKQALRALALSLVFGPILDAQATLEPKSVLAESLTEHAVPGKRSEACIVPKHFPGADYDEKDLEHESALCLLNSGVNAAVCPKTNSTNPGLDWFLIPDGMKVSEVVSQNCFVPDSKDKKDNALKKVAKYKLSTSCSYAPSIIAYYHLSRILGDVANVPVVVYRTFDLENHKALAEKAMLLTRKSSGQQPLIYQTWSALKSALDAGKASQRAGLLFTNGYDQSYGALQKNPTDEEFYKEFFNKPSGKATRAQAFRDKNPIYKSLTRSENLSKIVGTEFNQKNVQLIVQMKDAADMIILDTILNQQDRFGNIHYVEKYYYRDLNDLNKNGVPEIKTKKKLSAEEVAERGAVKVKEMILKDNDCGVTKTNHAENAGLVERIAHIDPSTYKSLQRLGAAADHEITRSFFIEALRFTRADYDEVSANIKKVARVIYKACVSGRLKLSLNLEDHFSGTPYNRSCDDF